MDELSRARPELIEYEPAPQFRARDWLLALLGIWVVYILLGGGFNWPTFLLGIATGVVFTRWIVGVNGYKPNANSRLIGPNVKLLFYVALLFGVAIATKYAFTFLAGGREDGWLAKLICHYLTGSC